MYLGRGGRCADYGTLSSFLSRNRTGIVSKGARRIAVRAAFSGSSTSAVADLQEAVIH